MYRGGSDRNFGPRGGFGSDTFGSRSESSQGFNQGFGQQQQHPGTGHPQQGFPARNQSNGGFERTYSNRTFGSGYGGNSFGAGAYGGRDGYSAGAGLRPVDWKDAKLPPVIKNIYCEAPEVTSRSDVEIQNWLELNQVVLAGQSVPRPVFEFKEGGYPSQIVSLLYKNYDQPTIIQSISWPVALSGRDMISIAKTGSGKTLGFLLPGIMHISNQPRRRPREGPSALILLPTRELAQQVADVAREYCSVVGLTYACLYGGAPKNNQAISLQNGIDVCIATPGRLLDFLETGVTNMSRCTFLVLDEADRMLDMGFEPQIRKIVSQIRPDRQTLMFSATWPKEVRTLAKDFQTEPVFLNVGSLELATNHNIQQIVEVMEEMHKQDRLFQLLSDLLAERDAKILIFVETKRKADEMTRSMRMGGWPALSIHGDKAQNERDWVMSEFRSGKIPILLATDVAARGLDVKDVKTVINFDYPNDSESYVHRIGRTGRQDKKGVAFSFVTSKDAPKARGLINLLQEAGQAVPDELLQLASSGYVMSGQHGRSRYGGNRY